MVEFWNEWGSSIIAIAEFLIVFLILYALYRRSGVYVYISSNEFGVVEKLWSHKGSATDFISLHGRAGFQPEVLRTGPHFFVPFVYRVHKQKLITVRSIAYVYSRIGIPLPPGQTLAYTPPNITFENVGEFLRQNGQRGPQRTIVREGIYAFNTAAFVIFTEHATYTIDIGDDRSTLESIGVVLKLRNGFAPVVLSDKEDTVGVVTIHDGPTLSADDIIAPRVGSDDQTSDFFHNSYQNIEAFLKAGGRRGRQDQVVTEGTFFMNRWFATVESFPKTVVPVGEVGVVISYTGSAGTDISGETYRHGELVADGHRGVLERPLRPGKYPINPFSCKIEYVPTTNFVLRWMKGRTEDHGFDSGLSEIPLITKDAFQPMLPLSVVVHVAPDRASRVIQRFAKIKLLVDQTLDPIVSAFFKDAAQDSTMIELINKRTELQTKALDTMKIRFMDYDLDLQEVMIGTPRANTEDTAIPRLLDQLRLRQTATEQQLTYVEQQKAQEALKGLNEATSTAENQTALTKASIDVSIAEKRGEADAKEKENMAKGIVATGRANAEVIREIGSAEAGAIAAKVRAFEGEGADRQLQQAVAQLIADAIVKSPNPIVPGIAVQSGTSGGGSVVDALLAIALSKEKHSSN